MEGTVDRWFDMKGYGFIKSDDGQSIFIHHSSIKSESEHKTLRQGQRVKFDIEQGTKGPRAVNVVVLKEEEAAEETTEQEEMPKEATEEISEPEEAEE